MAFTVGPEASKYVALEAMRQVMEKVESGEIQPQTFEVDENGMIVIKLKWKEPSDFVAEYIEAVLNDCDEKIARGDL